MPNDANDTSTGASFGAGTGGGGSGGNVSGEGGGQQGSGSNSGSNSGQQGQDQGNQQQPFYSSLQDASLRQMAEGKGWKSLDDAFKSYKELETTLSQRPAPAKVPTDPKEYTFRVPENAKDIGYSEDFANWFKGAAVKGKVPVEAAAAIHDEFVGFAQAQRQAQATAMQAQVQTKTREALQSLEQTWGAQETPTYKRNMELAQRAVRLADPGLRDELKALGALVPVNGKDMIASPGIFKVLAKMGEGLYSEDTLHGDDPTGGKNPFADDSKDLAMQGRLMKTDPEKAELLIKAAGKDKFFWQFMESRKSRKQ